MLWGWDLVWKRLSATGPSLTTAWARSDAWTGYTPPTGPTPRRLQRPPAAQPAGDGRSGTGARRLGRVPGAGPGPLREPA